MGNRIHLKTIENFDKEKFGVEIEAKSFDNNKTNLLHLAPPYTPE